MGFWDDNQDAIPGVGGNFIKFETPGVEVIGTVTGMDVHTWAPRANPRTGVMETKKSPVVLFKDQAGDDKSVTLPTHAARLAFEQRLDIGDSFRLRFTHQEGNTKKFTLDVRKGAGAPAAPAAPVAAAAPAPAIAGPQPGPWTNPATGQPFGNPAAPAVTPAATGTDGAPW